MSPMVPKPSSVSSMDAFQLYSKSTVKDEDAYVFDVALNSDSNVLSVSLSSNNIHLYSLGTMQHVTSLTGHTKTITHIKFSRHDPSKLYSSSLDGTIRLWDIRASENPVLSFTDVSEKNLIKPLASFDMDRDENFMCAGTEIVFEEAFLVFWDARTAKLLGGYWRSHNDDITQVKFHPESEKYSQMATCSVDGLINVFNIYEACEEDALMQTLNTGSSVGKLTWVLGDTSDRISCITHLEELQLWDIDEAKTIFTMDREDLTKSKKVPEVSYLIDTYQQNKQLHLATGTHSGNIDVWAVFDDDYTSVAKLHGGHSAIVRCILWDDKSKLFITGGEDGVICCWKSDTDSSVQRDSHCGKVDSLLKSMHLQHKKKPYMKSSELVPKT